MASTVTWEELRDLASVEAEHGCAVSLYVNLDPSSVPTPSDVDARIRSLLDQGAKAGDGGRTELSHAQRQSLREDLDRIRRFYEGDFDRDGAKGLAVFASSLDNVWRVLTLTEPVRDAIRISKSLYVAPLVPLVGRGDGALVVTVSRELGTIMRLRAGRLQELEDLSDTQPRRHDQGGWSQARYQRRIDNLALEHLREVAEHLDRLVRQEHGLRIVVAASDDTWAEFSDMLSHEVSSAVVGQTAAEAHASPTQLEELVRPILEEWREATERKTIDRWREEVGRAGRATGGWAATLEATSDGRVATLLLQEGVQRSVWRCPACGRLSAEGGKCPLDGTALEERDDGLDLVVHQTLARGGAVRVVQHHHDLEPVDGIGASLRF
jgi:peptide chain release factor subunit 1